MAENKLYKKGDEVFVFYRMGKRCQPRRKYFAALDPRHGVYRPRQGMSEGWVPAKVAFDVQKATDKVCVEYTWPHFFTMRGHMADASGDYKDLYPLEDVRPKVPDPMPDPNKCFILPGSRPELSILTFRWGGTNEIIAPEQWGETGSSVSDLFVDSFVDMAVTRSLHNEYEVWTVYIEDHSDMVKLADSAHLIFGPHHPLRRARVCCGMYFLYPTSFEEGCVPTMETGEDGGAALVNQKSFFKLVQAVERCGIPTRFPHPSGFYEVLASKRWTHMMSLTPHLRVPPTVALPRMFVERDAKEAAENGLHALNLVRRQQAALRGEPVPEGGIVKGVAKLGFSWEALDVKFWEGKQGLADALVSLTQAIEISQELTGQPHDLESIIVQEYMPHDLELRIYVVEGKVEASIYTKFCRIKDNQEFGDFKELFDQGEAASSWMGGDLEALQDGERQAREITQHWMSWVQAQTCQMPPAIRYDYFIGRQAGKTGKAFVWTLEICELGFSMLGEKTLPKKVFTAMLRNCMSGCGMELKEPEDEAAGSKDPKAAKPAADAKAEAAPGDAPQFVYMTVPMGDGTREQQLCTGKYELVPKEQPNGMPLWAHSRGDRFLYFGVDRHWYVGDEEEQGMQFKCDQGYIRIPGKPGVLPVDLEDAWERSDPVTEEWQADGSIIVSYQQIPQGTVKSKGKGKKSKQR
mmetsp:Transcript_63435/g.137326  ORF Transcript_63435/g.137326 Transcript_63435/m.137326 type:complete len:691 (+) Transcript_63435:53-2125(+)